MTLQDYLRPNQILTLPEQRALLRYRVRSNPLQYNTPGSGETQYCVCLEVLKNEHLYSCQILNSDQNRSEEMPRYDAIFNGTLQQQKQIIDILIKNMEKIQ